MEGKKWELMMSKRIRRTKAQLEAGMSIIDVKSGISVEAFLEKKKEREKQEKEKKEKNVKHKLEKLVDNKAQANKIMKDEQLDDHTKVVQIVKIVYGEDESGRSAQQIIDEMFAKCQWEHKKIPLDRNFRSSMLNQLGKERWRLVFTHDPKTLDRNSKAPVMLYFQRSICPDSPKRKAKRSTT